MSASPCVGNTHMFSGSLYHMMPHQLCNCGKMDVREALKGQSFLEATKAMMSESQVRDDLMSGGTKFDQEKVMLQLISPTWIEGVGKVLTYGASKYHAENWRKGIHLQILIGGMMRHLNSFRRGEDVDPETGLSHLYHLSCMAMFASETHRTKPELDDRVKE